MRSVRRLLATILLTLSVVALAASVLVRVAYSTVFDTDTYVETVNKIVDLEQSRVEVSKFITDSVLGSVELQSGEYIALLQAIGIQPSLFRSRIEKVVQISVDKYMKSDEFHTLWSSVNRTAHEGLMKILNSDTPVVKDFTVDLGAIVKDASKRLSDPSGFIEQVVPLDTISPQSGEFTFTLIDANNVDDLRKASHTASQARWQLMLATVALLFLAWLTLKRTRVATRVCAISVCVGAIVALIVRAVGGTFVSGQVEADSKEAAQLIYSVVTAPITALAVTSL